MLPFGIILERGLWPLDAVELVDAVIRAGAELHVVEHEELGLGTDEAGVADARGFEILLGLLGRRARVAVVELAGRGFDDIADQDEARLGRERIHHRRVRVGHQDHVALVDRLPAGDRGAVEHDAVAERLFIDRGDVLRGVLPLAARIGEAKVHILDGMLAEHLHHLRHAACRGRLGLSRHTVLVLSGSRQRRNAPACLVHSMRRPAPVRSAAVRSHPRRARRCGCAPLPRSG